VVGIAATDKLSNGMIYGYITIISDKYRGMGLAKKMMPDFTTEACMGSSGAMSIARRGMSGLHWLEKRHGLYGYVAKKISDQLSVPEISGIRIEIVKPEFVNALLDYDEKVVLVDRKAFVRRWSTPVLEKEPEYGRSVMAIEENSGRCLGYGTMRLFSDYYGIQPLYADTDEIAGALMIALAKWGLDEDAYLYMPLMAAKRKALEFCFGLGMVITGTEFRSSSTLMLPYAKSLPIQKVYAVHEYYPV